jgi:hypothetical protein
MEVVNAKHLHQSIATYGTARVSIGNFVLAFRVKTDPDGGLLDASKCRKARLTFADKRSTNSPAHAYYSACVSSSSSSRLISQLAVEHGAFQHTIDVSGAYYKGKRTPASEGGRLVYARIPTWLQHYGAYPTHAPDGTPNYIWITGNMAGCADAGCIWEAAYDHHLLTVQGMTQSVYDTRVFYKKTDLGFIIAHVHVDDTRLTSLTMHDMNAFYTLWAEDLNEERKPLNEHSLDENFAGIRHRFTDRHTCVLSCTGTID